MKKKKMLVGAAVLAVAGLAVWYFVAGAAEPEKKLEVTLSWD